MNYKIENYGKCQSCLYFIQHYSIGKCRLHKVNCGVCKQSLKTIAPTNIKTCKYFLPKIEEIEKQNNNKLALDVLIDIEAALTDLKTYLENQN